MWPTTKGEPVKITYGHDGSALYLPTINPEEPWQFARSHGKGYRFFDKGYTHTIIQPNKSLLPETPDQVGQVNIYRNLRETAAEAFIGERMFRRLEHESANISSSEAYDPTEGSVLASGYLKEYSKNSSGGYVFDNEIVDEFTALGYLDNASNSVLRVSHLDYTERSVYDENQEKGVVRLPNVGQSATLDLVSQIKQIQFADREPSVCPYILVRTGFGTSLIEHRYKNDNVALREAFNIPQGTRSSSLQVHSQFSRWSWNDVGIIKENSKWKIWSLRPDSSSVVSTYSSKPSKESTGTAEKTPSYSTWHRLKWGSDSNVVITGSRKEIYLNDIRASPHENSQDSGIFSFLNSQKRGLKFEVRDFEMAPAMPNKLIALTSTDLQLFDIRMTNSTPLITWEHRLSQSDPSLSFSLTACKNVSLVSVSSLLMPVSIVYQFSEHDGLPISPDDPFYVLKNPQSVIKSQIQMPLRFDPIYFNEDATLPEFLSTFELSQDHGLFRSVRPSLNNVDIEDPLLNSRESSEEPQVASSEQQQDILLGSHVHTSDSELDGVYSYDNPLALTKFPDSFVYDLRYLYRRFFDFDQQLPNDASESYLDDYALKLANNIKDYARAFKHNELLPMPKRIYARECKPTLPQKHSIVATLSELLLPDYLFSNPLEITAMIQQLSQHFQDTDIDIQPMAADLSMFLGDDTPLDNIDKVHEKLRFLYVDSLSDEVAHELRGQKERLCRYVAIDLALACICTHIKQNNSTKLHHNSMTTVGGGGGIEQYSTTELEELAIKPNTRVLAAEWPLGKPASTYRWEPFDEDSHLMYLSTVVATQADQLLSEAINSQTTSSYAAVSTPGSQLSHLSQLPVASSSASVKRTTRSRADDTPIIASSLSTTPARRKKKRTREGFA